MTGSEFKTAICPCYRKMYATAFAILRSAEDASDAVQDTVAALWDRREGLPVPDNPEAFCCRAVRNACISRLRKASGQLNRDAGPLPDIPSGSAADAEASFHSTGAYIARALEGFPDKQRKILTLSFISQLDYDEISSATGESPDNVRQIVSRGRKKLKEILTNEANHRHTAY